MAATETQQSRTVAELSVIAELGDDARQLATPAMTVREFAEALARAERYPDAIRFLAQVLPKREAVWWAWACARRGTAKPAPPVEASLAATEKWIAQPNDANRRAAMKAAQDADIGTPAGMAGLAAFLSGGSLAPPEAQAVPPGEFLTGKAVGCAIIAAAVISEPEKADAKYQTFFAQGMEVAQRIKLWERLAGARGEKEK